VRAATGEAVWSQAFDRPGDDLIGVEEAIATEVAGGVAGRLSPEERRVLESRLTSSGQAYERFLRGNVLLARRGKESMRAAIVSYRAATSADPEFADAFGRLAYTYALCINWGCGKRDSLIALSREAAMHGLRLNPRSSDAWMGRAMVLTRGVGWGGAVGNEDSLEVCLAAFRRAVDLNPRNDEAWHQYGATLMIVNDSAAEYAMRRALALDPGRAVTYQDLSALYHLEGRNREAIALIDTAIALEPDGSFRGARAGWRLAAGDTAGALADARAVPGFMFARGILAAIGHDSASIAWLGAIREGTMTSRACNVVAAVDWAMANERERAIGQLLGCGVNLTTRGNLRISFLKPLLDDPGLQALRAATDRVHASVRWR
jgi:tetratricopeptide (TPR) repeat protein